MKKILLLLLLSCPLFGQQNDTIIKGKSFIAFAGETYIDSIRVTAGKYFIDFDNVTEVRMFKANPEEHYKEGALLITRKKHSQLIPLEKFIDGLRKSDTLYKNEKIQLVVDGEPIQNAEGYVIEQDYIEDVSFLITDPKQKGDHMYHDPAIVITTKAKRKKQ